MTSYLYKLDIYKDDFTIEEYRANIHVYYNTVNYY